jgi:hypothetical protein
MWKAALVLAGFFAMLFILPILVFESLPAGVVGLGIGDLMLFAIYWHVRVNRLYTKYHTADIDGMRVQGTPEFLCRTSEALALLRTTRYFAEVREHLYLVKEGRRSGVRVGDRPVFFVGRKTWSSFPIWYASAMGHEAYHCILYKKAIALGDTGRLRTRPWSGQGAERLCMAYQLDLLAALGAPAAMIAYVQRTMICPTHQGNPKSWYDFMKRDW